MSYLDEVRGSLDVIRRAGNQDVLVLHCISNYPAAAADANLRAMQTMADEFHVPVGFSDHTDGSAVALAAVALGACVIEKHLTLDRKLPGPDHKASMEPREFKSLIADIRKVESSLGNGIKQPAASEADTRSVARRSLVAATTLESGTVLTTAMLSAKRPGTGIAPSAITQVVGKKLTRRLAANEMIKWSDLL
jgi:N-acetylneuraminate synthase/N,N'-diacetyllegionaminate synthase